MTAKKADVRMTVARRLRSLAIDRGKTSPSASRELTHLAEEVAALEELKDVVERLVAALVAAGLPALLEPPRVVPEELKAREERR